MIQSKRINGIELTYAIANPKTDDIYAAFKLGATVKELGIAEDADVAANVNFADNDTGTPIGRVIANGKTVISDSAKTLPRDELYMLPDKSLHIGKAPIQAIWALQGSPRLLINGDNVIAESIKRDQTGKDIYTGANYRIAVGLTAARLLVVVRTKDKVTLDQLAAIMATLGSVDALNGDGGGSAYLWPSDNGWGRKMGAALIIKKGEDEVKPELFIDAGHGGTDPGASGNGIVEKEYTLKISLYQYERFKALGVNVALTRDNDRSLDSVQRTNIVKDSGAKYCISNHINAAGPTTAQGVEVIHSIFNDGKLATALMQAVAGAGQVKRSNPVFSKALPNTLPRNDYYYMHRNTGNVSTVIVEYGFCSNATDAARVKANWQTYAEAVVRAYCTFVGHKYTPPVTEPVKPIEPVKQFMPEFKDVPTDHYSVPAVRKAYNKGIFKGDLQGNLGFGEAITPERLCVILDRLNLL